MIVHLCLPTRKREASNRLTSRSPQCTVAPGITRTAMIIPWSLSNFLNFITGTSVTMFSCLLRYCESISLPPPHPCYIMSIDFYEFIENKLLKLSLLSTKYIGLMLLFLVSYIINFAVCCVEIPISILVRSEHFPYRII